MMKHQQSKKIDELYFEVSLIIIAVALTALMWQISGHKLVVLNLFYLPVVLAGFFLGRYRAGVLAFLSVIGVSIVTATNLNDFAVYNSPVIIGLSVTLWAAVLGMTALLVGTLSDERAQSLNELHEAHVGVVEVLARYLQSANPKLKDRSQRVAELSQSVAQEMGLPLRECDDIRVAALLYDMENIEITAKVIRRAVGDIETQHNSGQHSFQGSELAHSLGSVLTGAFPLLMSQSETEPLGQKSSRRHKLDGGQIIRAVRAYDRLAREMGVRETPGGYSDEQLIQELRQDLDACYPEDVLDALERVVASKRNAGVLILAAV
jgi:K+-sensing histidine kinase KdpD